MTTTLNPESRTAMDHTDKLLAAPSSGGRDRRSKLAAIVLVVAAVGVAGAWALAQRSTSGETSGDTSLVLNTAIAEERDILEFLELDGTLTFADPVTWFGTTEGTITRIVEAGTVLERGDVIAELDEDPVVLFYGDTPPYRLLSQGTDEGVDVTELEENLVALGYDEDYNIVIDAEFDAATAAAVEAWQEDLGVAVTGTVEVGDYLVAAGPVQVQTVATEWGTRLRADSPIATVVAVTSETILVSPTEGTLFDTASVGSTIETGDIAIETLDSPIPAIVGDEPLTRELTEGDQGADVEQLEAALSALGYDADGELEIDDLYDNATVEAVMDWEADLDIDEDGIIQLGQLLVVPAGFVVTDVQVEPGNDIAAGQPIFTSNTSERIVSTQIDVVDQTSIAVGDTVTVELADGSAIEATVAEIATVAQSSATDLDAEPYLDVVLDVSGADIGLDLVESPVKVRVVDSIAEGVTVVPASALVALREGGHAVEVVSGGSIQLVGVETADFNDGFVEVTGEGIGPGTEVVVP